jgi:predicted transcriptional regulator
MIDTNALRGKIAERGLTQAKMAKIIGVTPKTFYEKMKRGVFGSDEIETMIQTLRIEKPMEIFFTKKVSL